MPTYVDLSPGKPTLGSNRAIFIAAGGRHSCAIVSHGGRVAFRTTGSNEYGQLGHNDTVSREKYVPCFLAVKKISHGGTARFPPGS